MTPGGQKKHVKWPPGWPQIDPWSTPTRPLIDPKSIPDQPLLNPCLTQTIFSSWSTIIIDFLWISLILIGYHWFSSDIIDFRWISLIFVGYHWFSLDIIDFLWLSLIFVGYHWFSLDIIGFRRIKIKRNCFLPVVSCFHSVLREQKGIRHMLSLVKQIHEHQRKTLYEQ